MTTAIQCVHYWIIEEATAPTSKGVCLACREVRQFKNSLQARAYSEAMGYLGPRVTDAPDFGSAMADKGLLEGH